ncbi:sugar phosphate nucleotidyltransferase [Streptacidiphilus jiangxiensis]|uniref:UTP--glucose-1-phosphate uridylyltransferase n=1 Tax=Streptacidiphilus jiangxiensis TaxID=235985 RepID=A0A1H8B4P7_STRJI|nr:sugar phosphate nucleotidyltransferase [Streptacidiphilus jiangxiensis]SEM77289.1 UTP--glucose-1-phosphate uridylyltransferase [Streptacidiphilus jiangxiensis]
MRAVIAAAGMGTRFFPIGKTITKAMLPVLDRPVLAYAIADCVAAGAREIAIVTAPGEAGRQIRHYLSHDPELEDYCAARGWQDKYGPVAHLHRQADFTFIEQPRGPGDRYGTAVPAILAADFIGDHDFLLVSGDDLLLRADDGFDLADLAAARTAAGTPGAIAAATVPGTAAHRYGILHPKTSPAGNQLLAALVEKPPVYELPTAYINISRALLPAEAVRYFEKLHPAATGEYQATDAVAAYARDHDLLIHPVTGEYHDCGSPAGLLTAAAAAARAQGLAVPGVSA